MEGLLFLIGLLVVVPALFCTIGAVWASAEATG